MSSYRQKSSLKVHDETKYVYKQSATTTTTTTTTTTKRQLQKIQMILIPFIVVWAPLSTQNGEE